MAYKLTIRRGPRVSRERYDSLKEAVAALRDEAESVIGEGALPAVNMIRNFEPEDRVAARLEISAGGLRGSAAGIDVMGDGSLVPFQGGVVRKPLRPRASETPYDAVRKALA